MKTKQVIDIQPNKGAFSGALSDEHQRRWNDSQWERKTAHPASHYDRSRSHLNFEIGRGGVLKPIDTTRSIPQRFEGVLTKLGIKNPNVKVDPDTGREFATGRITTVSILFGGSREQMRKLAFGDEAVDFDSKEADNSWAKRSVAIERWAQDMYRFACEQWGEESIIGFYVHLDEYNPHIHCTVIPLAETRGRKNVSFNKAFWTARNKGEKLLSLHSQLAKVNAKYGLERGDSIAQTGAKHRSIDQYRRDVMSECYGLDQQLRQKEKKHRGLTTMVDNLRAQTVTIQAEINRLSNDKEDHQEELDALQCRLQNVKEILADKETKLREADSELAEIRLRIADAKRTESAIREANRRFVEEQQSPVLARAYMNMLPMLIQSIREVIPQIRTNTDEDEIINDSFMGAVKENPNEVVTTAIYLFLNMVNEATNFAQTHGGGGDTSQLPWRDKNDDDNAWFRKCLTAAAHMMKPKQQRAGYSGGFKRK